MSTATTGTLVVHTVRLGDLVLTPMGTFRWAGRSDAEGIYSIRANLREGYTSIQDEPESVAPAAVEHSMNLRDERLSVVKQPKEARPRSASGPWFGTLTENGKTVWTGWFRTKGEGTLELARRLAIIDWHKQDGSVEV